MTLSRTSGAQRKVDRNAGSAKQTLTLRSQSLIRTDTRPKPFTVNRDGFSLNAAVSCQPHQRERLERLCRYITRPPLGLAFSLVDR